MFLGVAREVSLEEALYQAWARFLEVLVESGAEEALLAAVQRTQVAASVAEVLYQVFQDSSAETLGKGLPVVE